MQELMVQKTVADLEGVPWVDTSPTEVNQYFAFLYSMEPPFFQTTEDQPAHALCFLEKYK